MKLLDTALFSLAIVFLTIGVYESFFYGIEASYAFFMVSLGFLFMRMLRKMNRPGSNDN
jgi:hypothetical protein